MIVPTITLESIPVPESDDLQMISCQLDDACDTKTAQKNGDFNEQGGFYVFDHLLTIMFTAVKDMYQKTM